MKKKKKEMNYGQLLLHIPNPMHLEACKKGSNIYKNRKKYSRKGKNKYHYQKTSNDS